MDAHTVGDWVLGYQRAWRTPGTDLLAQLFTDDATYLPAPFADPVRGLAAIAEFWDAERVSAEERFTLAAQLVALDGRTAVVRVEVEYLDEPASYRDLWVIRFDDDGRRARRFEEWPFFPGQPLSAGP